MPQEQENDRKISWSIISHIEWIIVFVTLLGGFYSLDSKIDAVNFRMDQYMIAWHEESKDFHGRLERQDAEFKARMERQDAEFKFHLMHHHNG
jgi:hypothetical protein